MSDLKLDVDQAGELKAMFRRERSSSGTEWTNEGIKAFCERKSFGGQVLDVLLGFAEIKPIEHLINLDADPFVPNGWRVAEEKLQIPGRARGHFKWDPTKVKLHLSKNQKNGKYIVGNTLRGELSGKSVLNANALDYLLAHPHLIPEEWKGKAVFFWGTIYRGSGGGLFVRCLCWGGGRWSWGYGWLGSSVFGGRNPAAVRAS